MGQSINPVGYRLVNNKNWNSIWHNDQNYVALLHEDLAIRKYLDAELGQAGLDRVLIKRSINQVDIDIYVSKPGMVIGRGGARVEEIKKGLNKITDGKMNLNVFEVEHPDLSARAVADDIAYKIVRRMGYKRVVLKAMQKTMDAGAQGIKVYVSGRVGGGSIARTEKKVLGSVPTSTISADVDFARSTAPTKYGTIGIKVWIAKKAKNA